MAGAIISGVEASEPISGSITKPAVPSPLAIDGVDNPQNAYIGAPGTPVAISFYSGMEIGSTVNTFFNDFYFCYHLEPSEVDLGNVISGETQSISLWNAYPSSKDLSDFTPPLAYGLSVSGQSSPYTMAAFEELTYTITIDAIGDPSISETVSWVIDGFALSLPITGTRIVEFLFKPNWSKGVKETFSWLTDVISSFSGKEQRRKLRTKPRREYEYTVLLSGDDLRKFQNRIFGWQNRPFAVPMWHHKSKTSAAASAGDTVIYLDTSNRSFVAGGLIGIVASTTSFEAVEVESVTSTSLVLGRELSSGWPAGTPVYPIMVSRLPAEVPTRRITSEVMEAQVTFKADPADNDPAMPEVAAVVTLDGYEVITRKPNWIDPLAYDSSYPYLEFDSSTGANGYQTSVDYPALRRAINWLLSEKADVTDFKALLNRLSGRWKAALVPTWFKDGTVTIVAGAGETSVTAYAPDYARFVGFNPMQEYLMVTSGASVYFHKITSVSSSGEDVVFGVAPALTGEVSEGAKVTVMHRCRLSTDDVTIDYKTDGVATVTMTMESVKA